MKISKTRKVILLVVAALLIAFVAAGVLLGVVLDRKQDENKLSHGQDKPLPQLQSKMGIYHQAAVATDEGRCSTIGKVIMQKNGSAVDAAIATMVCIGVLNTQSAGIGGGSFMVVYERSSKTAVTFNFRETAPGAATADMYSNDTSQHVLGLNESIDYGALSIAVPGEVKGYWAAHQRFGRLTWKELFDPTIKLCEDGFELGAALAGALKDSEEFVRKFPGLSEVFVNKKTGELFKEGEMVYRSKLAGTLRAIATEGPDAFYNGSLSQSIVDDIREHGGIITLKDLRDYSVKVEQPIQTNIGGMHVYSIGAPSSGAIMQYMLNIMDGYRDPMKGMDKNSPLTYHRIVEAFKFAYARKSGLGDGDFADMKPLITNLTSRAYADATRSLIWDNMTHPYAYYGSTPYDRPKTGTSHASIIAPNGDAVSLTSTINYYLGSKIRGKRTGIIFNNEMDDFSLPTAVNSMGIQPSAVNFVEPGKRPLSSMCPAIFVDSAGGQVKLVIGASGGTRITTATAYVAMRTLWFGENVREATDARRLHHQLLPQYIKYEQGFPKDILHDLRQRRHNISDTYKLHGIGSSIVQTIHVNNDKIYAVSDFRKTGYTDGF